MLVPFDPRGGMRTPGAMRLKRAARLAAAALCCGASLPALAHITANPNQGVAGSYFQTALLVSHGCGGSATIALKVTIPASVLAVKPQMKPGWTISETRRAAAVTAPQGTVASAAHSEGGAHAAPVDTIEWRGGPLSNEQFDSFGLLMKLPDTAGQTLYLPVEQVCEQGRRAWADLPAAGQAWHDVPSPAPYVKLTPAGP
jgi:uncharacterized protein YcnI